MQNSRNTTLRWRFFSLNLGGPKPGSAALFARLCRFLCILSGALLIAMLAGRASADEVTRWNQIATDASAVVDTNPLRESCVFSILHVAIHNAVNAVESRYEPYHSGISPTPGGSVEAAIASA